MSASKLDAAVWSTVAEAYRNPAALASIVQRHLDQLRPADSGARIVQMERNLEAAKKREFQAVRALTDPELADEYDVLKLQVIAARNQRQTIERELASLRLRVPDVPVNIGSICEEVAKAVEALSVEERQEFLRRVVEVITVTGREVEIRCALPLVDGSRGRNCSQHRDVVDTFEHPLNFLLTTRVA